MSSPPIPAPLDVFNTHKATLVSELETPVECVVDYCRDADIIDLQFHKALVSVTNKRDKAEKLVNAVCDRIEAQPAQVEQEECVFKRFIGVLRRESSHELTEIACLLETSYAEKQVVQKETEPDVTGEVQTEGADNSLITHAQDVSDPLDELISKDHMKKIGKEMRYWKKWAEELKLTGGQISGIASDPNLDYNMVGQKVLNLWQNSHNATYRALCKVALAVDERGMGRWICKLANGDWSSICPPSPVLTTSSVQSTDGTIAQAVYSQPVSSGVRPHAAGGVMYQDSEPVQELSSVIDIIRNSQHVLRVNESTIQSYREKISDLQRIDQEGKIERNELVTQLEDIRGEMDELRQDINSKNTQLADTQKLLNDEEAFSACVCQENEKLKEEIISMKLEVDGQNKIHEDESEKCVQKREELLEELEQYKDKNMSLLTYVAELTEELKSLQLR